MVGGDGAGNLGFAIDLVDGAVVDDGIRRIVGGVGVHLAVGRDDVQPLGEEQVDLRDVLLQRGVAGGVVFDVISGAQTFTRVQGDVAGFQVGSAVSGPSKL